MLRLQADSRRYKNKAWAKHWFPEIMFVRANENRTVLQVNENNVKLFSPQLAAHF